jgi:hypothetical protein
MHTSLSLSNVGGQWYVEREIAGLTSALRSYCDSIHSCDISVEGPTGEGEARCWRIGLKIRLFGEIVRALARAPEGVDPRSSLSRALADICGRAKAQLKQIAEQHGDCCAHGGPAFAAHLEACA